MAVHPATWRVLWWLGIAFSALQGLRFAHPYARVHWLFHYGHGFVKRALPGQLVRPLILGKSPGEVRVVLDWLTAALAIGTASALVAFSAAALSRLRPGSRPWWAVVVATTTLVFSPFRVGLANLSGYFDQLLVLATLAAVSLVARERPFAAGMVGVLAVLSHEMFALFGLPVIFCACVWHGAALRSRVQLGLRALGPPLLALASMTAVEHVGQRGVSGGGAQTCSWRRSRPCAYFRKNGSRGRPTPSPRAHARTSLNRRHTSCRGS